MKIRKAYKFRLKPTIEQAQQMESFAGHCRFIWNKVLALSLTRLENKQGIIWFHEADFWSKIWKSSDEYAFLKEVPAQCIQQKLRDLNKAFKDGFDKKQPLKRIPTTRKRGIHDSFRFPEPKQFQIDNRRIKLPKLGWVKFFKSQEIMGEPKNITISKQGRHWYVSIQVEMEIQLKQNPSISAIGIDLGIAQFAAQSDGLYIEGPNALKDHKNKLAKAQRSLSRKKRFSNNWKKQKTKIGVLHTRIAHIRKDFLHKTSTHLCKSHAMIVVEDLKITNMSKSAKGTVEEPGKSVKAKSGLNRAILDQGWGEFRRQLEYKMDWAGGVFVKVPPQNTSITCSICEHKDKSSRIAQEKFCCVECGHTENADLNAAKNILAAGHAELACGENALAISMKQEPLETGNQVPA